MTWHDASTTELLRQWKVENTSSTGYEYEPNDWPRSSPSAFWHCEHIARPRFASVVVATQHIRIKHTPDEGRSWYKAMTARPHGAY